jgi:hypothetical protein
MKILDRTRDHVPRTPGTAVEVEADDDDGFGSAIGPAPYREMHDELVDGRDAGDGQRLKTVSLGDVYRLIDV